MRRRPLLTTARLCLLALFCASALFAADALQEITVRPGDTLWAIANFYLKDPKKWPELLKYNAQLTNDPTVALPGMRLQVPVLLIKESLRAAELVYVLKDVRFRKKESADWKDARLHMELFNEDGLRTMNESIARIRFPTGEIVGLNENSLVIIRPEKGQDTVQLLAGDVRAKQSRVVTAGGAVINPLGPDTDYGTRVKLDKSELVLVYRGRVDVTAQGKTVRVPEGFGSEVRPLMAPTEPIPLPKIPMVFGVDASTGAVSTRDVVVRTTKTDRDLTLSVQVPEPGGLTAAAPSGQAPEPRSAPAQARALTSRQVIERYHLQIDDKREFQDPIVDKYHHVSERLKLNDLGLPNGAYFWRIAFVDSLGMEGTFSSPQTFQVDLTPPTLTVADPSEGQEVAYEDEFYTVRGNAEPNTIVRVDEKSASVDAEGHYSAKLFLREGKNRFTVVAEDSSGNVTRMERVVYRLLPGQKAKFQKSRKHTEEEAASDEEKAANTGFFASVGVGILAIGTILGIVLLIIQ